MASLRFIALAHLVATVAALPQAEQLDCHQQPFKRVITLSIDGLHGSDVERWTASRPNGSIAALLKTGYEYTNAWASAPSDSFPGTCALFTGATPKTTGVWYDDIWDRSYYSADDVNCTSLGGEVAYSDNVDYNNTLAFSGGINPASLPRTMVEGVCTPLFPHQRLRVNTIWEIAVKNGLRTAYTDKHPSYDLVRGPSGTGLSVGYFPEIAAYNSSNVSSIIEYDKFHVNAWLAWLDGQTPAFSEGALYGQVPSLMGGNFQAVSAAEKAYGYVNNGATFSPQMVQALTFVDDSIGAIVNKLKAKGMYEETLIVVASKHGQGPINRSTFVRLDPTIITNATGVEITAQTSDNIALIFLKNQNDLLKAVEGLNAHRAEGKILSIIYGKNLTMSGFGDPTTDPAVPDIIVQPVPGVIYTTSTTKFAEHGGLGADERIVAAFVSNPRLKQKKFDEKVYTTQFAPTVLQALDLPVEELEGAKIEGTKSLPGFA